MGDPELLGYLLGASALAVLATWIAPRGARNALQALCGIGFLAAVSPVSLAWLGGYSLMSFVITTRFAKVRGLTATAITLIAASYLGWLLNRTPADIAGSGMTLPLGMAFYSLRLIHYLAESAKAALPPHRLDELLAYQFFCATLPVGPIHRFGEFARDLRRRRWDSAEFSSGLERILYGLLKLIVVGNYAIQQKLAPWLTGVAAQDGIGGLYASALLLWLPLFVYFSAYSDLALGFGKLMGFKLRENFNHPYLATNIADFWQRWHISLASWCRDYVYTPVLALTRSTVISVTAAMLILGLWHELSMHYVLWGLYHGLGIAAYRRIVATRPRRAQPRLRLWDRALRVGSILLTLHFVLFSFAVTAAVELWLRGALTQLH